MMNRDREKEFVINLDGVAFPAVKVVQYTELTRAPHNTFGFPYRPTQIFCYHQWEGFTKQQAWAYLSALEDAVVVAEEWEAERKEQEGVK